MVSSRCLVSIVAGIGLMASTTAAVAAKPVRPGSSTVALAAAVATQSATTSADESTQAVSRKKSPHAQGTELFVIGLGVALAGALGVAVAGGGHSNSVSPD